MRYLALACDYDGTLASGGYVAEQTLEALKRLRSSGRKLVLVTGRRLGDLLSVFAHADLFDRIIAENGALIYQPETRQERVLAEPPPDSFIQALKARHLEPLETGRVVVATEQPNEATVLRSIRDLGLELQVIFNKGAVMVLPAGVNKASGLRAGLEELGLSAHNVVGIGDAENDHAFLSFCECSVVVSNALAALKRNADWVTEGSDGQGVVELIDQILQDDLHHLDSHLTRHHLVVGRRSGTQDVKLAPYGHNVLLAGASGAGKSTMATSLLAQLAQGDYQFCVIDPEGDYESLEGAFVLGNRRRAPSVDEVMQILEKPGARPVINLLGLPLEERPGFLMVLLPRIQEMRGRFGRPHWLVIDEAHHMVPRDWKPVSLTLPREMQGTIFVTVHPNELSPLVLSMIDVLLAVGDQPGQILTSLNRDIPLGADTESSVPGEANQVLFWAKDQVDSPFMMTSIATPIEGRRHRRKYAEGELPPESSFYFTGPEAKLNLRANNLIHFLELADGVDDATWTYHLKHGGYSRWFRDVIKDGSLADEVAHIERSSQLDARETRELVRNAIEHNYTLPAISRAKEATKKGSDTEQF